MLAVPSAGWKEIHPSPCGEVNGHIRRQSPSRHPLQLAEWACAGQGALGFPRGSQAWDTTRPSPCQHPPPPSLCSKVTLRADPLPKEQARRGPQGGQERVKAAAARACDVGLCSHCSHWRPSQLSIENKESPRAAQVMSHPGSPERSLIRISKSAPSRPAAQS